MRPLEQFARDWDRAALKWQRQLEAEMDEAFRLRDAERHTRVAGLAWEIKTFRETMLGVAGLEELRAEVASHEQRLHEALGLPPGLEVSFSTASVLADDAANDAADPAAPDDDPS